jgi:hypothetical protein
MSLLVAGVLVCYLVAFGLHNFMVMRANRGLPKDDQLPYSLSFNSWNRVATEYRRFYPRSQVYGFALSAAVMTLALAIVIFIIRFWGIARGK